MKSDYNQFVFANPEELLLMTAYCHNATKCQDTCELGLEPSPGTHSLPKISTQRGAEKRVATH